MRMAKCKCWHFQVHRGVTAKHGGVSSFSQFPFSRIPRLWIIQFSFLPPFVFTFWSPSRRIIRTLQVQMELLFFLYTTSWKCSRSADVKLHIWQRQQMKESGRLQTLVSFTPLPPPEKQASLVVVVSISGLFSNSRLASVSLCFQLCRYLATIHYECCCFFGRSVG
jgi:hypothetical protein